MEIDTWYEIGTRQFVQKQEIPGIMQSIYFKDKWEKERDIETRRERAEIWCLGLLKA